MKIIFDKNKIKLIPEHDMDCFDLGRLSKRIRSRLKMISGTDNPCPKITTMEITSESLLNFIFENV